MTAPGKRTVKVTFETAEQWNVEVELDLAEYFTWLGREKDSDAMMRAYLLADRKSIEDHLWDLTLDQALVSECVDIQVTDVRAVEP